MEECTVASSGHIRLAWGQASSAPPPTRRPTSPVGTHLGMASRRDREGLLGGRVFAHRESGELASVSLGGKRGRVRQSQALS